ncbi:MAG: D-glycero-beta-D-manno-heptose 1-phosphate adenylyltransferase [Saprospiraceae bacterium]|nr:D-glycero-beta-D-manno-heptose 1-phosphate adenylyltransferase [Saprospiraceae bacterium]
MKVKSQNKIVEQETFLQHIKDWQNQGLKVVFSNGCFDILHPGHVDFLEQAKAYGDKLVIALNTNASVSRIKGDTRPINNEDFRSQMLAAIHCVDIITFFDENTPIELIVRSNPDILVKGSDYQISEIVGAKEILENGGEVKTVSLLPGFSTTGFIERIKRKTD